MEAYLIQKNEKIYKQPVSIKNKEVNHQVIKLKVKEQEEGFAVMLKEG
jgi:hypothetical protein